MKIKQILGKIYKVIFISAVFTAFSSSAIYASEDALIPAKKSWSWTGFVGSYDKASLQRGLQVYTEVCSSCHSLKLLKFRNLAALGYNQDDIKSYARQFEVQNETPDDQGDMFLRQGLPKDAFVPPYANDMAARAANNGAFPPDLSLIIKSRATGKHNIVYNLWNSIGGFGAGSGADYVFALLTNFEDPPKGVVLGEGMNYNEYFAGHQISMAPPIDDDIVEYTDGTLASKEQIARDVVTFLAWASEPELEQRKEMGIRVLIFLFILFIIVGMYKRRVWADVKKK